MSDGAVYVTFGADTSELEASLSSANAAVRAYARELATLSREQVAAGASAESDLGQHMLEVAEHLAEAREAAKGASEAIREHGASEKEAAGEGGELKEHLDEIKESFMQVAELAGLELGLDAFKEWVNETTEAAEKVERDAAKLGVSMGEIQRLQGVAKLSGTDYDELTTQFERLQLSLAKVGEKATPASEALRVLGVSAAELRGQTIDKQFETLAEAFSRFGDGPTKTAAAIALLGKAGADMIPILDKGKEGIEELQGAVSRAGSVMSNEGVESFVRVRETLNELSLATTALGNRAFAGLAPYIDLIARELTQLVEHADPSQLDASLGAFSSDIVQFMRDVETFASSTKRVWDDFVQDVARSAPVLEKELNQAAAGLNSLAGDPHPAVSEYNRGSFSNSVKARLASLGLGEPYSRDQEMADDRGLASQLGLLGGSGQGAAKQYDFGGLDAELVKLNMAIQDVGQNSDASQKKLADLLRAHAGHFGISESEGALKPQVPAMSLGGAGKSANDAGAEVRAQYEAEVEAAREAAESIETTLNGELQRHQITMSQWLAQSTAVLNAEQDAIQDAADKALGSAALNSAQKIELATREAREIAAIAQKLAQDQNKAAEDTQKSWDKVTGEINSAFDSQVNGLLRGTTSWGQAFKNVLATLTEDVIKFALKWTLTHAEAIAENIAGVNAEVTAHVAGNAVKASSDAAASSAGAVAWIGNTIKAIEADAAQAFGGVFAFLAPILGPAAAGPAAAASASVMAAGGAVASADIGMWSVPSDMLTMVHHNELIMPAAEAGAFRNLLGGSSGGGGGRSVNLTPTTHFHINANDAASVRQWVTDNAHDIVHGLHEGARQGAHLGLRGLAI